MNGISDRAGLNVVGRWIVAFVDNVRFGIEVVGEDSNVDTTRPFVAEGVPC